MSIVKNHSIKKEENSKVQLTITVDGAQTRTHYNQLLAKYAKEAQFKGFRKGHVPTTLLEKKYGQAILSESYYNLLENAVKEALDAVKEKPLQTATPKLLNEEGLKPALDEDFTFTIEYDTFPEVKLGAYTNLEVELPTASVDDKAMEEELKRIQEQNAMMIDKSNGKVEKSDSVTIDYAELDEKGNVVKTTKGEDFTFTIGSGYGPYKIDEELIGKTKDETVVVTKSYSDDESDEKLRGKKNLQIQVKIKTIKHKEIPALDDELAQDVSEKFKTLDDLKNDIKQRLNAQLENRKRDLTIDKIFDKIIESSTMEVPESMIEAELNSQLNSFGRQMGMNPKQISEIFGKDSDGLKEMLDQWRPATIKNLKQSLIVNEIVDKEKITVTNQELEDEYAKLSQSSGRPIEELKEYYAANNAQIYLKSDIQSKKAIDFLVANNKVKNGKKVSYLEFMQKNE